MQKLWAQNWACRCQQHRSDYNPVLCMTSGCIGVFPRGTRWYNYIILWHIARGQNCWNGLEPYWCKQHQSDYVRFWYIMDVIEKKKKKRTMQTYWTAFVKMHKNALLSHGILRGIFFLALWSHIVHCKFLHAILQVHNNIPSCNCKW